MSLLSKHKPSHSMAICQWNCFKLTPDRIIELNLFLQEFQPDIMSIQEVKLTQEQVNIFIKFQGYTVHYKPRLVNPAFGRGVLILIKNTILNSEISGFDVSFDHLRFKIDCTCFYLVSLYAPSNTLKSDLIKKYCELGGDVIILGDLNAKTPTVGCRSLDANGRVLEDVLDSDLDLCVLNDPSQPTYFKFNRRTSNLSYSEILDLFLCSKSLANKLLSIEVLANTRMDSDHAPVMCTFGFNMPFKLDLKEPEPRFNFTKADWVSFGKTLDTMISELGDVDRGDINGVISTLTLRSIPT